MRSEQMSNGLIVQFGTKEHDLQVEGKMVRVYEVQALGIKYGGPNDTSNKAGPAASGFGFTSDQAWEKAVSIVKGLW